MKVSAGIYLCLWVGCLRETRLAQAAKAFEDLAALAADRLRADGCQLVAPVRFVKGPTGYAAAAQSVQALEQLAFAWDSAHDQVGMRQVSG
jgi:hypothetical protein